MPITVQTGANKFRATDITKYSLMMGGLKATNDALKQYDPLVTGYYRIFMVRKPKFVAEYFNIGKNGTTSFDAFRHILEYGNLGVSGLGGLEMQFTDITGGYAGKSFAIPTVLQDSTTRFQIRVPEFSGGIMYEVLHTWLNGISDSDSGLAHYYGQIASGHVGYSQANQTAEFIYCATDRTGMRLEWACMLANCIPTSVPADHYNGSAGDHDKVELDIEFTCTKYTGIDVNKKAIKLLKKNQIMVNSLEFATGLDESSDRFADQTGYDPTSGQLTHYAGKNLDTGGVYRTAVSNSDTTVDDQTINYGYSLSKDGKTVMYVTPSYTAMGNRNYKL